MMRVSSSLWDLPCFAIILCQIWGGPVAAGNYFLQPWTAGLDKDYSKNIAYNTGEEVIIEWAVSVTKAGLQLFQDNFPGDAQGGPSVTLINDLSGTILNWVVTYGGLNPSFNNVYYLYIVNSGNDTTSHYFNISGPPLSTTSSIASTSTSSTSSISSTSTLSTTVTTISPPAAPTVTTKGSSLSSKDIAGVVIGCLGAVALLLGTVWWFWRARKQRVQADVANFSAVTQQATKQEHELAGSGMEHELPGAGGRRSQVWEALGSTTFSS